MKKIAVLFSGEGSNFDYIVTHLHKKEYEVVVALTNNPFAKGIEIAKKNKIPLEIVNSKEYPLREKFDIEVVKRLKKYQPNLTVLAGFMRILTTVFTKNIKAINLHPSLLPRHKGLNAIEHSYNDSFKEGGVSVHFVNEELDSGEIILQKTVLKEGLSFELYDKAIRDIEKKALIGAIKQLLGEENAHI